MKNCPTPWCSHSEAPYAWQGPDDQFCVICPGCQVEGPSAATQAEALTAWNTRANADARLVEALRQIKHSIGQARILGNDWKRELALIENLTDAALSEVPHG